MQIKGIIDCDLVNYKKPCLTIEMPKCSFKCDKECGIQVCQNSSLASAPTEEITILSILNYYMVNPITEALCFQGLEPFDTFDEMLDLISDFRKLWPEDDIIIYTGYNKNEIQKEIDILKQFKNIIIKFGRFIPNQNNRFDEVLGVTLSSDNQYAEVIS